MTRRARLSRIRPAPFRLQQGAGWLLVVLAILLALAACAAPASRYPDAAATGPGWKDRVRVAGPAFPAWRLQIREMPAAGPSVDPLPGTGLAWRTLFGVQYGETIVEDGPTLKTSFSATRYFGVLLAFVAAEVLLVGLGSWFVLDAG